MKKIFFVGNLKSSFIRNDYVGLQKYFEVKQCKVGAIINPTKSRMYLYILDVFKNVIQCDTVFGWFASWRMIFPTIFAKILNKKIVVVAGGYDVVNAPEINYGAFTRIPDRWISKFVFKHANIVLPVSEYIQNELLDKLTPKKTQLVYNGVDINKFYPQGDKIDNLVITVGEINWSNLKRKGIEDFVKAAKYAPEINFVVIGGFKDNSINYLKSITTNNVMFLGFISDEDLLWWYQKAPVYAQLSFHEGFGISVAEAMLCECIPVVTNKGALAEVTGMVDTLYGAPMFAAAEIKIALKVSSDFKYLYRDRIVEKFSLKKRIEHLKRILE